MCRAPVSKRDDRFPEEGIPYAQALDIHRACSSRGFQRRRWGDQPIAIRWALTPSISRLAFD
jgi:hypothetical protein